MQRWRSFVRAFGHGIMLTGLPVIAFLAIDYVVTPPAGSRSGDPAHRNALSDRGAVQVPATGETDRQQSVTDDVTKAAGAVRPKVESILKAAIRDPVSDSRPSLVVSIQEELRRVGCYAGDADGAWNNKTKAAMLAFNASVHVNLPADRADYLLLTLLQGHSSKACVQSCGGDVVGTSACIDRSIEARAAAPASRTSEGHGMRVSGRSEAIATVTSAPVLLQRSPATTTVVLVAPSQAAEGSLAARKLAVEEPLAREGIATSAPLPGRMAIGAVDATALGEGADAAADPAVQTEADALKEDALAAAARPKPTFAGATQAKRSFSFSDLSRSAP